jgi:3',5'-cyclic AMP phosphodiesterase CpdA
MAARLTDPGSQGRERHVIHLGDTYYAGLSYEYRDRLKPYWPVEPWQAKEIGSWCVNANHDMFTGGHYYFRFLDKDPRFSRQNGCSYFALENDYWLIVGLDTAWESEGATGAGGGLQAPQFDWLLELLAARRKEKPRQRLILLSHHQLFSRYEHDSPLLMSRMESILNARPAIDAWFWGHEHRCAVYKPTPSIDYPALIGHGGVPVFADSDPKPEGVWYEYKAKRPGGIIKKHAMMGFAVVDLDNERAVVHYINEEGLEHETHESAARGSWKALSP